MSKIQNVADISIIIPTYNRCELLKRAINSVLYQTINVREIIVLSSNIGAAKVAELIGTKKQNNRLISELKTIVNL